MCTVDQLSLTFLSLLLSELLRHLLALKNVIGLLVQAVNAHALDPLSTSAVVPISIVLLFITHTPLLHLIVASRLLARRSVLLQGFDFRVNLLDFQEHPLHLNIVVFPQVNHLFLQFLNLLIFLLLAFNKSDRVVEAFFLQMGLVVLAEDLNLAAKVVVRALH